MYKCLKPIQPFERGNLSYREKFARSVVFWPIYFILRGPVLLFVGLHFGTVGLSSAVFLIVSIFLFIQPDRYLNYTILLGIAIVVSLITNKLGHKLYKHFLRFELRR